MATFLDIGLLQGFNFIFPFLLVLIVVWGALSYSKFLGGNKGLHGLIALVLAILVLISQSVREIINTMAPWFILLFMFIFFLLLMSKMESSGGETDYSWLVKIFLVLSFVIFIYSIIDVQFWNEDTNNLGTTIEGGEVGDSGKEGFYATLRHPTVMGLILVFLIAAFTIHQLATKTN